MQHIHRQEATAKCSARSINEIFNSFLRPIYVQNDPSATFSHIALFTLILILYKYGLHIANPIQAQTIQVANHFFINKVKMLVLLDHPYFPFHFFHRDNFDRIVSQPI